MDFKPITFSENVLPGDTLQFHFSYSYLLYGPSVQDIQQAVDQAASFNVSTVKYDLASMLSLGASGTITGVVSEATTPQDIAADISQILGGFSQVRGATITEVDKGVFSISPSPTTTISLVAIAAIAIVVLIFFLKID